MAATATLVAALLLAGPVSTATAATAPRHDTAVATYVSGTVRTGVEAGCMLLVTSYGVTYTLLGGDPTMLWPGARLLVYGEIEYNTVTICMQGYPLKVISAWPS